jgi:hypothetical protein
MSNILRRPMFRGGKVSSYGNGIASGMGYATGGRVGLAQSYPGTVGQAQKQAKGLEALLAGINKPTTGADLLKLNPNLQLNPLSIYLPSDQESIGTGFDFMSPSRQFPEQYLEFMKPEKTGYETNAEGDPIRDASGNLIPLQKNKSDDFRTFLEQQRNKKITESDTQGSEEQYGITDTDKVKPVYDSEGKITGYTGTEKIKTEKEIKKPGDNGKNVPTESTELSVEDYIKMLGGDKARRRDVSDMLGRASAAFLKRPARGETRGITEALGDFMAAETAAGPGRTEKIEQAAAMLDIKDKIESKRSQEQLKTLLGKADYEAMLRLKMSDTKLQTFETNLQNSADKLKKGYKNPGVIGQAINQTYGSNSYGGEFISGQDLIEGKFYIQDTGTGDKIVFKVIKGEPQEVHRIR